MKNMDITTVTTIPTTEIAPIERVVTLTEEDTNTSGEYRQPEFIFVFADGAEGRLLDTSCPGFGTRLWCGIKRPDTSWADAHWGDMVYAPWSEFRPDDMKYIVGIEVRLGYTVPLEDEFDKN